MSRAIAFVPEIRFGRTLDGAVKVAPGLSLIPSSHEEAVSFMSALKKDGHLIAGGLFIYFDGSLREDGTLYEIFQSYCLALTFYYEGRATCRALQEMSVSQHKPIELFIDEFDQFRYDPDDARVFQEEDIEALKGIYEKISGELASKMFNPLGNSVEFFTFFLKETQIRVRLLYLNICLESLFLGGADAEGVSYKLGMRCAHLVSANDKTIKKQETFTEVKNGYDLRSKIIHGSDYEKASQKIIKQSQNKKHSELDHIVVLEKIAKRVYKIIFSSEEEYQAAKKGSLGTLIDDKIMLSG